MEEVEEGEGDRGYDGVGEEAGEWVSVCVREGEWVINLEGIWEWE